MLRVNEIKIPLDYREEDLYNAAAKAIKISPKRIEKLEIVKKSVDSRKKDNVMFVFSVDVQISGDEDEVLSKLRDTRAQKTTPFVFEDPPLIRQSKLRPVVVGFGPAGIFAALILAKAGLKPLVLERGADVDTRTSDVKEFWEKRTLKENSNVQFGEGGAGTFSDGKLTTGIKDKLCRKVFLEFCEHGAPEEILYSSKPHIGTDKLAGVVKSIREEIVSLGGEVLFNSRLTDIIIANGVVHGLTYEDKDSNYIDFETDTIILSIGHSARDTVEMLYSKGIKMIQKPFSVGTRIEHPREMIDKVQYGAFAGHPALGAADYKLACHPKHGRGAYTFCMCPGGTVVMASSEKGGVVVNGMSEYARDKENSNSALLVGVEPQHLNSDHPLEGMYLQRQMEQKAFELGGGDYTAPAQLVGDFLNNRKSEKLGSVKPSCPTGVKMSDLRLILPKHVTDTLADALPQMDRMFPGFAMNDAVLTGPETRSSSPVRILRDEFYQTEIRGLYPCGEGAGYAGGIVSAAVDGMRTAIAVMGDER